jgi:DNA-binding XRE family transcriptional regulator
MDRATRDVQELPPFNETSTMKAAIMELIGRLVATRRANAGHSQEYVSAKVGISRQSLSLIERGETAPRWETLYALSEVLRCEVFDLIPSYNQVRLIESARRVLAQDAQ